MSKQAKITQSPGNVKKVKPIIPMQTDIEIRSNFPILSTGVVYLDNGATTQKSNLVIDGMYRFMKEGYANVHRGLYPLSVTATEQFDSVRRKVADLIGSAPEEIIFTKGTTESINLLAHSIEPLLDKIAWKDEIVVSALEHHANLVPWQELARRRNLQLKIIPLIEVNGHFDLDYSAAERLIGKKTAIVSIAHVSNVLGTVVDTKRVCALAKSADAFFCMDAAQSIAHIPVSSKEADFIAFSSHKMGGPSGVGVLYGKKDLLEKMRPYQVGGDMIKKVTYQHSTWADVPSKFEAGTPAIESVIGLGLACDFLKNIGYDTIERRETDLISYAESKFSAIEGLKLYRSSKSLGIMSFSLEGIHPHDIADILGQKGICVRAGHHCCMPLMGALNVPALTRASFWVYNTRADIDALIDGLNDIKRIFKK